MLEGWVVCVDVFVDKICIVIIRNVNGNVYGERKCMLGGNVFYIIVIMD